MNPFSPDDGLDWLGASTGGQGSPGDDSPNGRERQVGMVPDLWNRVQVFRVAGGTAEEGVVDAGLLLRVLDNLTKGLLVCDRTGRTLYRNSALLTILEADPEHGRIYEEMEVLAHSVFLVERNRVVEGKSDEPTTLTRVVRTEKAEYSLRGVHLGAEEPGSRSAVLVVLNQHYPEPVTDAELQQRFGLTPQEIRIARLVAEGKGNLEIASALSISRHTVRHHVGHVLLKLNVHSRTEVGPVLLAGLPSSVSG